MSNERIIPSDAPKTVTTFTILSDGSEVSREFHVLSISVNKEINKIPAAVIIMLDGESSTESFEISSKPDFEPGKEIEIKAGYQSSEETIFKGIVVKHGIKVRKNNSVLVIECKDKAVKMTGACKSSYFSNIKDSEIMEDMINSHGLEKDVSPTGIIHEQLVQHNCTDWDFMLCRCNANGLFCFADNNKISISSPGFGSEAVLTIQFGATVLDLDAEIDSRIQYKSVKGSSWNYSEGQLLDDVEAADPGIPLAGNLDSETLAGVINNSEFRLFHGGLIDEPELQAWVNSKMMMNQLAKIRGKVRTTGTAAVKPGQIIQLNGTGERFEGKLFVTGIRHEIEDGSWQTVFQFGINPEWFAEIYNVQQPLAGALLPAVVGLQNGIVAQLQDDPAGEDRVLVRIPIIHKDGDGAWCRVSTLDAGENRGTFFRPEIGDEVVVGFINNDPRQGILLGMCNSSSKPAPLTSSDDNNEKGYVSRSKMKMIFDDDKKSMNFETPGGNKFLISEENKNIIIEDQNGNKITLNNDGIKMESAKDIILKAAGDIKAEGINLNLKGSAQTKVEGGASGEISSGGTTKIKGAIVQIN